MTELILDSLETGNKTEIIDNMMTCYGQQILQLSYSYVKNQAIAQDLTQEIFIKCYQSLHTYKGKSAIKTWLWRIAINHCKDYLKSWYNKNVILTEDDFHYSSTEGSVEEKIVQLDEDEQLVTAIMNLPIKYREVIYLFYYEELTMKEISAVLSVKQNTIKTRLRKAKQLLKKGLEE